MIAGLFRSGYVIREEIERSRVMLLVDRGRTQERASLLLWQPWGEHTEVARHHTGGRGREAYGILCHRVHIPDTPTEEKNEHTHREKKHRPGLEGRTTTST